MGTRVVNQEAAAENAAAISEEQKAPDLALKLEAPFMYNGEEVSEIDLANLPEVTFVQMAKVDKEMLRRGYSGGRLELTREYAILIACEMNGKPYNWLNELKARDCIRLKELVSAYFFTLG